MKGLNAVFSLVSSLAEANWIWGCAYLVTHEHPFFQPNKRAFQVSNYAHVSATTLGPGKGKRSNPHFPPSPAVGRTSGSPRKSTSPFPSNVGPPCRPPGVTKIRGVQNPAQLRAFLFRDVTTKSRASQKRPRPEPSPIHTASLCTLSKENLTLGGG